MASFGHVAVGMLAGRLHGGSKRTGDGPSSGDGGTGRPPTPWWTLVLFSGLALLPDADVLLVALGACDTGVCGHRGASHSFPVAIAIGLIGTLLARRLRWPAVRTGVATTLAVGSHAVLDLLAAGGRGLPLFWPFSDERFASPIRLFSDAPRGLALLSWHGFVNVTTELAVFLPLVVYALWPRIAAWRSARALARSIPPLPSLTFIEGGAGLAPAPAPTPAATDDGDPSVRSVG